jgi:5-methyltetrahydrofolate--homocysteine methyltransferase
VVWADEARLEVRARLPMLRQQNRKGPESPNLCLADFVLEAGEADWIGGFVVTAGLGVEARAAAFEKEGDDYQAILLKALADRLAEAAAEMVHAQVRREAWGYAANEDLDNVGLIAERYQGIRPAPGYPACPDHSLKRDLFALLGASAAVGVSLTESTAMSPAASVAGWYFGHPEARYFGVGKITGEQAEDYARRRGLPLAEVLRDLSPILEG